MMRCINSTFFVGLFLLIRQEAWPQAFPINSNVAIQPAEGQMLYRTQLRYRRFDVEGPDAEVNLWSQSNVFVYGWTPRISTVIGVPLLYRELDVPTMDVDDFGFGDINLLLRYQLWKKLDYLESQSWTVISGVQIPSYDDDFSSRSWDPVVGAVYSWRKGSKGADIDAVFQYNTENDRDTQEGAVLQYDVNYQHRLWPPIYQTDTNWTLTGLLEVNGVYKDKDKANGRRIDETDKHQLLLSPGLVISTKRVRYEAGLQIPIIKDVGDSAEEDDMRFAMGITFTF